MKRDPDADALSWGDESDPTYVAPDLDDDLDDAEPHAAAEESSADDAPGRVHPAAGTPALTTPATPNSTPANPATPTSTPATSAAIAPFDVSAVAGMTGASTIPVATAPALPLGAYPPAAPAENASAEDEAEPLSSAALITFGLFGGILFLYSIGWLVGYLRTPPVLDGLGGIVQTVLAVMTIGAPALWFIATLLVGAKRPVRLRILWLIIGVIVLVPWPFVTGYHVS